MREKRRRGKNRSISLRSMMVKIRAEGFVVFIGQFSSALGLLVSVKVFTDLLEPQLYGILSLLLTFIILSNQMIYGPLGAGLQRFYSIGLRKGLLPQFFSEVKLLGGIASALSVVCTVMCFSLFFDSNDAVDMQTLLCVTFIGMFSGLTSLFNAVANAARRRSFVAIHSSIEAWGKLLLALLFTFIFGATISSFLNGYLCSVVLVLISQTCFFNRPRNKNQSKRSAKKHFTLDVLKFVAPFSFFGFFTWGQSASERWALELAVDTQSVGLFAVIVQLGYYPMSFLSSVTTQYFAPILYSQFDNGSDSLTRRTNSIAGVLVLFTAVCFILSLALYENIFSFLLSPKYQSVSVYFPHMVLSGGMFATAQSIALNLMARRDMKSLALVKSAVAALGIVVCFIGANSFGLVGVVYASLVHSLVLLIVLIYISNSGVKL